MADIISYYLTLVGNPHNKKSWADLGEYYASKGLKEEADAFAHLLAEFFNDVDRTHSDTQQRNDNQQGDSVSKTP